MTYSPPHDYAAFRAGKAFVAPSAGIDVPPESLHPALFPFQRQCVSWALRKGRCALFLDTGLGKSLCELVWAQHSAGRSLILAPLAVAQQMVREAAKFSIPNVRYVRRGSDCIEPGIYVTNYEMLEHFGMARFGAVVLDESSILKSFEGKVRTALIEACSIVPRRLCGTATPAPNDISEIANHAEFLGICSRTEMLATWFVHDDEGWRLKGHAAAGPFWRWLASWSMSVRKPSDLGFDDAGYDLPPLSIEPVIVNCEYTPAGQLFPGKLKGVGDRAAVRKATVEDRVEATARLVAQHRGPWLVWCGLNPEGDALEKAIPGAVQVRGSDSPERKAEVLSGFAAGDVPVLVTKPSIAGFGLNFQVCSRMVFVGLSDSYEQYYQAIRRCWRFGQERPVRVWIVLSEAEQEIHANVLRKEAEAQEMASNLIRHVASYEREELASQEHADPFAPKSIAEWPAWITGRAA